ncbi:hypothetical protein [Sphingopyxis sp. GW247-27LB]|uniref:hypothetical protein n=1 Tax=Sphingopyxis sp. GW247-27LB TaxID=2012632 RepID=UPI000BA5E477|nr:hypothetical protein [Sphingopyxis sp. GW247-27LB]PAL19257.1 hypothetical protein CD928_22415 [Sphingopyxis sp. GW247-27LB]
MIKLLAFLAALITFAALIFGLTVLICAPFHWLAIAFMSYCRPRLVLARAAICFMTIWLLAIIALPPGTGALIGMLLAIFLTPWPARVWANHAAFRADDSEQRSAAADIRNMNWEREGSRLRVTADKPWREYITDSERARLISTYQLPASFPR